MIGRIKWVDRKFNFDFPADFYPEITERLRGTPARVAELIRDIPPEILRLKEGTAWSIQEHVGHLVSVESLVQGRLADYAAGKEKLRPADMTNRHTEEARYKRNTALRGQPHNLFLEGKPLHLHPHP